MADEGMTGDDYVCVRIVANVHEGEVGVHYMVVDPSFVEYRLRRSVV